MTQTVEPGSYAALESLLRFVMTTTCSSRGTLSIGIPGNAALRAAIGFSSPTQAARFAEDGDATRTLVPFDDHALLFAIVTLASNAGAAAAAIPEPVMALLGGQIARLIEADCLEVDLIAQRRNLASIVDDALEPFISLDDYGVVREWNAAAGHTFGWSRSEAIGKPIAELVVPQHLEERCRRSFARFRATGQSDVVGKRLVLPAIRRDGVGILVEMRGCVSHPTENGTLLHAFVHDITELERTRNRLTRSENLLREAQKIVALGSFEHDLVSDRIYCSDEVFHLLGIDKHTFDGRARTIASLVHPADLESTKREYYGSIEEHRQHEIEYRIVRPDGATIVVRGRGYAVYDRHGRASRMFATMQDVTAIRRTEAERRELEISFAEAFDNAPLGMSMVDARRADFGAFIRVNPAYCELFGAGKDELIGRTFTLFDDPDERARTLAAAADLVCGRESVSRRETCVTRRDGTHVWIRQTRSLMRDPAGEPLYFFTHTEDITQRRTDQVALADVNRRLQRSLDDAPIGMALTSTDEPKPGRFLEVNPALCRITGFTHQELVGRSFDELVHPKGRRRSRDAMHKLLTRESAFCTFEEQYVRANGTLGWMSVHASIAYDGADRPMYCITQIVDITKRKQAESKLEHLAYHDALTGALNRRGFALELQRILAARSPSDAPAALLLLDLDHFKYINDTMGHAAGDRILRRVAKLLRTVCRRDDVIARLGGDEFVVVLLDGTELAATRLADEFRRVIQTNVHLDESDLRATASIGIAVVDALTPQNIDDAVAAADAALAVAKTEGRDRSSVSRAHAPAPSALKEQITWSQRIRRALARDEFRLFAQPILDLQSGEVHRYELLLRLIDTDGQIVLPADFLHVAERCGLMPDIDRWVVRHAIRRAAILNEGARKTVFEINLSGASLTDERVAACIERELRASTLDPRTLVFEITETAAIDKMDRASSFAEKITALGCSFALDDFGAGFSSFYYLKYLPFDFLKIDGEFIRNLTTNAADQHIVKAIVELARGLAKATIAEFVGDAETVALLQSYGVDFAQGYYIGKPQLWNGNLDRGPVIALPVR